VGQLRFGVGPPAHAVGSQRFPDRQGNLAAAGQADRFTLTGDQLEHVAREYCSSPEAHFSEACSIQCAHHAEHVRDDEGWRAADMEHQRRVGVPIREEAQVSVAARRRS